MELGHSKELKNFFRNSPLILKWLEWVEQQQGDFNLFFSRYVVFLPLSIIPLPAK